MKGFRLFGEVLFEYFVVTLLLVLSLALVIPFIPIFIGLVAYFRYGRDYRMFRDIFKAIRDNFAIILKFTILELLMFVFSLLNLYFFVTHYQAQYIFIIAVSSIALFIAVVLLVNAPVVIVNMKVSLRGLLNNSFMMIFGGAARAIMCLLITIAIIVVGVYVPYIAPFILFFMPLINAKMMMKNLNFLKARALKTTVAELQKQEADDHYLNEYGEVDHTGESDGSDDNEE